MDLQPFDDRRHDQQRDDRRGQCEQPRERNRRLAHEHFQSHELDGEMHDPEQQRGLDERRRRDREVAERRGADQQPRDDPDERQSDAKSPAAQHWREVIRTGRTAPGASRAGPSAGVSACRRAALLRSAGTSRPARRVRSGAPRRPLGSRRAVRSTASRPLRRRCGPARLERVDERRSARLCRFAHQRVQFLLDLAAPVEVPRGPWQRFGAIARSSARFPGSRHEHLGVGRVFVQFRQSFRPFGTVFFERLRDERFEIVPARRTFVRLADVRPRAVA